MQPDSDGAEPSQAFPVLTNNTTEKASEQQQAFSSFDFAAFQARSNEQTRADANAKGIAMLPACCYLIANEAAKRWVNSLILVCDKIAEVQLQQAAQFFLSSSSDDDDDASDRDEQSERSLEEAERAKSAWDGGPTPKSEKKRKRRERK